MYIYLICIYSGMFIIKNIHDYFLFFSTSLPTIYYSFTMDGTVCENSRKIFERLLVNNNIIITL